MIISTVNKAYKKIYRATNINQKPRNSNKKIWSRKKAEWVCVNERAAKRPYEAASIV